MIQNDPAIEKNALEALLGTYRDRDRAALKWKAEGKQVVGCLGSAVPEELLIAAGYLPVRISGNAAAGTELTDRYVERAFDPLERSQFGQIVGGAYAYLDHLVISNSSDVLIRMFHYLRELRRVEPQLPIPDLYFFDFLNTRFRSSGLYNRGRVADFRRVIENWTGQHLGSVAIAEGIAICNENRSLLRELQTYRQPQNLRVSGVEALQIIGASLFLPRQEHSALLRGFLAEAGSRPILSGVRLFVTGSAHDHPDFYELVESCGAVIVGEDHDWGARHFAGDVDPRADWVDGLTDRYHLRQPGMGKASLADAVQVLVEQVRAAEAEGVIFYQRDGDEPPAWNFPEQEKALKALGIPVIRLERQTYKIENPDDLRHKIEAFVSSMRSGSAGAPAAAEKEIVCAMRVESRPTETAKPAEAANPAETAKPVQRAEKPRGTASVKRLKSATDATAYQRSWFKQVQDRVAAGEPFAFVNADVPMEIFRAMDIPFVVNQWWGSVCSAKQMSPYYLGLLKEHGYRRDLCRYCALALGGAYDPEPAKGPWGGLPKPSLTVSRLMCDAQGKIFELMARQWGVPFYPLENTIPLKTPDHWWEKVPRDWENFFEAHRIDLMTEELKGLIRFIETTTDKTFNVTRFKEVMELINQQEAYYIKTRDLIASTVPAPVSITDQVPSVMIPQWQRGTQWGVDSARAFYEEVREMADRGEAACPNERVRLMWIGRGLWFNLGFYQHFEERYGAAFIWSIYLGIAADGYVRYGGDPLRALASRFVGMEDFLHMPPWNSDWYVKEAKKSQIHGVVHLVSEGCTQAIEGAYFIKKALEDAGIPVLDLHADPIDAGAWNDQKMTAELENFIESRLGVKP